MDFITRTESVASTSIDTTTNDGTDLESFFHLNDINKYTYFTEKPHKNLYCPVCFDLYKNPVLIDCSHTVCNTCILHTADSDTKKCPIDKKVCTIRLSNKNIEEQIDDLLIRCRYGVSIIKNAKNFKVQFSVPNNYANDQATTALNSSTFAKSYSFNKKQMDSKEFDLVLDENGCKEEIAFGRRKYTKIDFLIIR